MENAVKALLMAVGVLIGIMIISLGVNLYSSLNVYVEDLNEELLNAEVGQFNEQFVKYINYNTAGEEQFVLTIQDVVTAANIAFENNRNNGYYVTVNIGNTKKNLEKTINDTDPTTESAAELLGAKLDKKYKCTSEDVKIDTNTGRVFEINFYEM